MKRASFRSELSTITLDEGSNSSWVQALKVGTYQHPLFGEIDINAERVKLFAENANAKVLGKDLDIDYDHKKRRDDAAGWVSATEARPDGVWYQVEWTDEAARKIKSREYRYFSAEFADMWTHPESGRIYSDVLFGGGLTNRPFIKGMVPVNLSESEALAAKLEEEVPAPTGDGGATEGGTVPKALDAIRTALKLSEGTSEEDVLAAVVAKLNDPAPTPVITPPAQDLKALADADPRIAKLLADQAESATRLAEMETAMRLSEVRTVLHEVDADTTVAITPAVKSLAEPLLVKLPARERSEVVAIMRLFAEGTGTVKLGGETVVSTSGRSVDGSDPVKKFTDLVASIEKEDKLTYRDAVRVAMQRDNKLFQDYHQATDMLAGGLS